MKRLKRQLRKTRKRKQKGGDLNVQLQIAPISTNAKGVPLYSKIQFETSGTPTIEWSAPPQGTYYTLLCVDPDSSEPAWLHWLAVNCVGGDPASGTVLTPWESPTPPTGTHRYYFNLYSHSAPIDAAAPATRSGFDTDAFVKTNGLKLVSQTMLRVKA